MIHSNVNFDSLFVTFLSFSFAFFRKRLNFCKHPYRNNQECSCFQHFSLSKDLGLSFSHIFIHFWCWLIIILSECCLIRFLVESHLLNLLNMCVCICVCKFELNLLNLKSTFAREPKFEKCQRFEAALAFVKNVR